MTALEHQLATAVQRLEQQYADREQAMREDTRALRVLVERLSRQVTDLSGHVDILSAQLARFVALLPPS